MNAQLYGDTIRAVLPESCIDASTMRPIPDSQEVFVLPSPKGGSCDKWVIFDLLEYVPKEELTEAIQYHFLDLVGEVSIDVNHVSSIPIKAPKDIKGSINYVVHNGTTILGSLIRLKEYDTDLLVSINFQQQPDEQLQDTITILESITRSCDIHDPKTLFG